MDGGENQSINQKEELIKSSIELNKALNDQKSSSKDLEEFKKDYSLLFNKMLNGFALHKIILDKEGKPCDYRFLEVNPAFEKLTGFKGSEIIGKTLHKVLPVLDPYWIDVYGKVAMTGKSIQFESYSQSLCKYFEVSAYSPRKGYLATIFSDITELKKREEKITKLYNLQASVRTINQLLLRANNEKHLYQQICDIIAKIELVKFVWIGLTNAENFDVKPIAYAGEKENFLLKVDIKWDNSQSGKCPAGMAIKTAKPYIVNNVKSDLRYLPCRDDALKRGYNSIITLPLIHGGKVIGAMGAYSDKENAFSDKDVEFFKEVANDIAVGVKSIRFEKRLEESNQKLQKLYSLQSVIRDINQFLLRTTDEKELYQKICDMLIKLEFVRFTWVGLAEEKSFGIKPVAYAGAEEGFLSKIKVKYDDSKFGNDPAGSAIKTGKPLVISDIKTDPRYIPWREEALKRGFVSDIALPLIHEGKVIGVMNIYSGIKEVFAQEEVEFLSEVANDIAVGIKSIRLENDLQKRNRQLQKSMESVIFIMGKIGESKDPYTAGHQKRVTQLATAIAKKMRLSEEKIEAIRFASLIHDIGKVGIPSEILSKPTKLNENEFALIKDHPSICYNIIKDVHLPWEVADIVWQHHERLDGSGYPRRLKDKEILLEAKILCVADVVEAMSSHRPYRPALGIDKALEEISMNKGKLYDPDVVDACVKLFKEDGFKFKT